MKMKKIVPILLTTLLFCIVFIVAQIIASVLIRVMGLSSATMGVTDLGFMLHYTIAMTLTLALTLLYERRTRGKVQPIEHKAAGFDPMTILLGVVVIVAISIILVPLGELLPVKERMLGDGAWTLVAVVVLAPIFEEVIFRGVLYNTFRHHCSVLLSASLSALLFGAIHLEPVVVIEGFFAGFLFSYLYIVKRSIFAPIILHMCNNAMAYALSVLSYADKSIPELVGGKRYYVLIYVLSVLIVIGAAVIMIRRMKRKQRRVMEQDGVEEQSEMK